MLLPHQRPVSYIPSRLSVTFEQGTHTQLMRCRWFDISRIFEHLFSNRGREEEDREIRQGSGFSTVDSALSKNTFTRTSLGQFVWTREHNRHTHAPHQSDSAGFSIIKPEPLLPLSWGGRLLFGFLYPSEDEYKTNAPRILPLNIRSNRDGDNTNDNDNNIHIDNNARFKRVSPSRRKAGHERSVLSTLHHHRPPSLSIVGFFTSCTF